MDTYIKLCRHLFARFRMWFAIAGGALAVWDTVIFLFIASGGKYAYLPYAGIIDVCKWMPIFLVVAVVFLICLLTQCLQDMYQTSRAIYTLMLLPGPFWALPLAWTTLFLAATCFLAAVQLALTIVLYPIFLLLAHLAVGAYRGQVAQKLRMDVKQVLLPEPGMRRGLLYAFLDSRFLYNLLPLRLSRYLLWFARLLFPAAAATVILSDRRWKSAVCGAVMILAVLYLHVRCYINESVYSSLTSMTPVSVLLLLLEIGMILYAFWRVHRKRNLP